MITKPMGYDEAEATVGVGARKLPAGNYKCAICNAEVAVSKKGNNMLVLTVDIADGEYDGYYNNRYISNLNYGTAKWDNGGMYYQIIDGESVGRFKGLLEMLTSTNNLGDVTFPFDEKKLIGCYFAGQFREEESEYNGKVITKTKLTYIRPLDELNTLAVLEPKKLAVNNSFGTGRTFTSAGFGTSGFDNVPAPTDEDIPF